MINITFKNIAGIDLGTTNSVISILENNKPIVLKNIEGEFLTPSVVSYNSDIKINVGYLAKRQIILNSYNTISSSKRLLGKKYSEIYKFKNNFSYLITSKNDDIQIYIPLIKKKITAEIICSYILKKIIHDANKNLYININKAIITVPAYFNEIQRKETKKAGNAAGIEVLRIINEPTAAALAYGFNKFKNEIILVFDFGGGTTDISILEVGNNVFEVLATFGDINLGGDDIDNLISNYIFKKFIFENQIDPKIYKNYLQRIIKKSENAKIELSYIESTTISVPYIYLKKNYFKHVNFNIDKYLFENLIIDINNKCKYLIIEALEHAKLNASQIDKILLIGGSTKIPSIKSMIKNIFKKPLYDYVNPEEAVSIGAAIQGGIISGKISNLVLIDVINLSLGIEILGGLMHTIIKKNSSLPIKVSKVFSTSGDLQKNIIIHILQGQNLVADKNKSLGKILLSGIPLTKKGTTKIKITFSIDLNSLLTITINEYKTGISKNIKIKSFF